MLGSIHNKKTHTSTSTNKSENPIRNRSRSFMASCFAVPHKYIYIFSKKSTQDYCFIAPWVVASTSAWTSSSHFSSRHRRNNNHKKIIIKKATTNTVSVWCLVDERLMLAHSDAWFWDTSFRAQSLKRTAHRCGTI